MNGPPPLAEGRDPAALLSRLIRFDTTNPPGHERACMEYLGGLLREAGIAPLLVGRSPERPNLVARLPGRGQASPLLVNGHVDVVGVTGQSWTVPPSRDSRRMASSGGAAQRT